MFLFMSLLILPQEVEDNNSLVFYKEWEPQRSFYKTSRTESEELQEFSNKESTGNIS